MRKILLGAAGLGVVTALMSASATAAPSAASFHAVASQALVTDVDFRWHNKHYKHRQRVHGHYRYY